MIEAHAIDVVELAPGAPRPAPAPIAEMRFHARAWLPSELQVLRTIFVEDGIEAALDHLPGRTRGATFMRAHELGVRTKHKPIREGVYRRVAEEALELRKKRLSYAAIGLELGMCEAAATNAVLVAECRAAGNWPLERDADGRISAEGRARLRRLLEQGLKHRDIQVQCGIAASTITRERRLYERELAELGLPPLPPPGNGEAYSGVPVSAAAREQVEGLFLQGFGAAKINALTGVSKTSCGRIRNRLIRRLRRKGECLPGCDIGGKRRGRLKQSLHYTHPKQLQTLERLLMDGWSVATAATYVAMCRSRADKHVHARIAAGVKFPKPTRCFRKAARIVEPLPKGCVARFRQLLADHSLEDARDGLFLAQYGRLPDDESPSVPRQLESGGGVIAFPLTPAAGARLAVIAPAASSSAAGARASSACKRG